MISADFAFERLDWTGLGTKRFVIPSFQGRASQQNPLAGNRMTPLFGGKFLELGPKLASVRRRRQKRSDDAEAKVRPPFVGA